MEESNEEQPEEKTMREKISDLLANLDKPMGIAEIVREVSSDTMHPESLIDDINHVLKSLKVKGITFRILPATCRKCDFSFKTTKMEVKIPSKCPKCKGELINPPMIERK
ncbi:MAG TPA: transcriptional regulator [Candidatus Lokiarchaeia archaeon]|nr:transcriptional regulator [Candidatus Lokiarchaeia archaeon]